MITLVHAHEHNLPLFVVLCFIAEWWFHDQNSLVHIHEPLLMYVFIPLHMYISCQWLSIHVCYSMYMIIMDILVLLWLLCMGSIIIILCPFLQVWPPVHIHKHYIIVYCTLCMHTWHVHTFIHSSCWSFFWDHITQSFNMWNLLSKMTLPNLHILCIYAALLIIFIDSSNN